MNRLGLIALAVCVLACPAPKPAKSDAGSETCSCPANATTDFYADPTVTRSACQAAVVTGVRTPAACAFPTLTDALAAASKASGPAIRVIGTGATTGAPASFSHESFPLIVKGITLTTTDSSALSGSGLTPSNYSIALSASGSDPAVELSESGRLEGFSLLNSGTAQTGAIHCASGTVSMDSVTIKGDSGSGASLTTGIDLVGDCGGTFSNVDVRGFSSAALHLDSAANSGSSFTSSTFATSGLGVQIDRGPLTLTGATVETNGVGIVVGGTSGSSVLTFAGSSNGVHDSGGSGVIVNDTGELDVPSSATLAILRSGGHGLVVGGKVSANNVEVGFSGDHGVVIDTALPVTLTNPNIHHNGAHPMAPMAGRAGIFVSRAEGTGLTISADRPTVASLGSVHDNSGSGVVIGDEANPGDIVATVGDLDIFQNQIGVFVDQTHGNSVQLSFVDNQVSLNAAQGGLFHACALTLAMDAFHSNGGNQLVFSGPGSFSVDSPNSLCDSGVNSAYCYMSTFGVFAEGGADVTVAHMSFAGGGSGLMDFSAQLGSSISVSNSCSAITSCP